MTLRDVTILQTETGWTWLEMGRDYANTASAFNAVRRDDCRRLKKGGYAGSIITWIPNTDAGYLAARTFDA